MTDRPTPANREPVPHALVYRVPQVCALLGISRATFYRRVESGQITISKSGGVAFVKRESVERFVDGLGEVGS